MAESPRLTALPSSSDAEPYVPLSWTAVAAFAMAILFSVLLVALSVDAIFKKRPLLEPEIVILFVAIVMTLSFVGRRAVRNSEGTASGTALGIDLCTAAWWTALVLGLGYSAYWLAITLPIQNDAQSQVQKWVASLDQGDTGAAFHLTIPPNGRRDIAPGDLPTMEARYRRDFVQLRQSKLARMALRNKGEGRYEPGSIRDMVVQTGQLTCTASGTFVCPEGRFTVAVPLKATASQVTGEREKVTAGRQWQILPDPEGYITASELTPYGWAVAKASTEASEVGRAFLNLQTHTPGSRREAFIIFSERSDLPSDVDLSPLAAVGGWGVIADIPAAWLDRTSDRFFTLPGGAAPSSEQRDRFRRMWQTNALLPPGTRLKESKDVGESLRFTDTGLELLIPLEIPLPGNDGDPGAATGRLVLFSNEAPLLARLQELKAASQGLVEKEPADLQLPPGKWRVLRVESNLQVQHPGRAPARGPGG